MLVLLNDTGLCLLSGKLLGSKNISTSQNMKRQAVMVHCYCNCMVSCNVNVMGCLLLQWLRSKSDICQLGNSNVKTTQTCRQYKTISQPTTFERLFSFLRKPLFRVPSKPSFGRWAINGERKSTSPVDLAWEIDMIAQTFRAHPTMFIAPAKGNNTISFSCVVPCHFTI